MNCQKTLFTAVDTEAFTQGFRRSNASTRADATGWDLSLFLFIRLITSTQPEKSSDIFQYFCLKILNYKKQIVQMWC